MSILESILGKDTLEDENKDIEPVEDTHEVFAFNNSS